MLCKNKCKKCNQTKQDSDTSELPETFQKKNKKNKNMLISSRITLRCAKQDIDSAGAMHLVLLGYDDGKRSTSSAYILQCLS